MPESKPGYKWLIIGGTLSILLIALVIIFVGRKEIFRLAGRTEWDLVPWATALALVSYLSLSASFVIIYRLFTSEMPFLDLLEIGFVSVAVSNVTFFGGAPEYALRVLLMKPRGLTASDILSASVLHSYAKDGLYAIGAPIGVIYMLSTGLITLNSALVGAAAVFTITIVLISLAVFFRPLRVRVLYVFSMTWSFVTHRDDRGFFSSLDSAMKKGMSKLGSHPKTIFLMLLLIAFDWAAALASLHFCFRAVGLSIEPSFLVLGYITARAAGAASFTPGGTGVQEASMAGLYSLFGVPFTQALLGAILFRLVYYYFFFGFSLVFYRDLLHKAVGGLGGGKTGK